MQHVIIVVHLMLVLALIGVVLLQRSEGGGLGIGATGGFMTSRGTANVLTRATAILAGLFFVTSLMLSILAGVTPQADVDPPRRAERPDRARHAGAAWERRRRFTESAARRYAAGSTGGSSRPVGAAGAAVEMTIATEGPGNPALQRYGFRWNWKVGNQARRKRENRDASLCKITSLSNYAQVQSGSEIFALVESIRGG